MNTRQQTETRSSYTLGGFSTHPMPLKGTGLSSNLADWSAAKSHPFIIPRYRELFEERSIQPEGDTRDKWNDFEHYKMLVSYPTASIKCYTSRYGTYPPSYTGHTFDYPDVGIQWNPSLWGSLESPITGLPVLYQRDVVTNNFVKLHSNIDNMINSAVRTMLGDARPKVSLINSIIELKDFKTIGSTATRSLGALREAQKLFPTILSAAERVYPKGKRTLVRILGAVSDAFLQKEFNIDPLIKDISEITGVLETIRQRVNKLLADEGVRRRRDYNLSLSRDYVNSFSSQESVYNNALDNNNRKPDGLSANMLMSRNVYYTHALFHAQIEYSKYYQGWQRENALLLGFLDRLGVMFDPSILWNAIPWSFAIDWVVDVSQYLKKLQYQNLEPVTIVHKFCWSQRVRRIITCTVCTTVKFPKYSSGPRTACQAIEDAYIRNTQRLDVIGSLTGSGINPKEFILGSALALSRKR